MTRSAFGAEFLLALVLAGLEVAVAALSAVRIGLLVAPRLARNRFPLSGKLESVGVLAPAAVVSITPEFGEPGIEGGLVRPDHAALIKNHTVLRELRKGLERYLHEPARALEASEFVASCFLRPDLRAFLDSGGRDRLVAAEFVDEHFAVRGAFAFGHDVKRLERPSVERADDAREALSALFSTDLGHESTQVCPRDELAVWEELGRDHVPDDDCPVVVRLHTDLGERDDDDAVLMDLLAGDPVRLDHFHGRGAGHDDDGGSHAESAGRVGGGLPGLHALLGCHVFRSPLAM